MDLISADPSTTSSAATASSGSMTAAAPSPAAAPPPPAMATPPTMSGGVSSRSTLGEKKSKRAALMQIQSDTVSAAKAVLNPVRGSYMQQKQKQNKKVSNRSHISFFLFINC